MYDRVLVITINSYYSKVPSTGTAVLLRSTVPTYVRTSGLGRESRLLFIMSQSSQAPPTP